MTNNQKNVFDDNKDVQKNFEKFMKEYEDNNDKLMDSYYEENKLVKILKNKKVVLGIIISFLSLSCFAVVSNYSNMEKNGMYKKDAEIIEQKRQQVNSEAELQQKQAIEQKEIEDQRKLDEKNRAEDEKELNDIKNNFHPWDEQSANTNEQFGQNNNMSNSDYVSNFPSSSNTSNQTYQSQPAVSSSQSTFSQTVPSNTTTTATQDASQNTVVNQDSEWMSLKGIARDKNGDVICYIKNGTTTVSYHVGDYVGDYVITNINNSSVTVEDNNGYKMNLNK